MNFLRTKNEVICEKYAQFQSGRLISYFWYLFLRFAFIEYKTDEAAAKAIRTMNKKKMDDNVLEVSIARNSGIGGKKKKGIPSSK